MCTVSLFGRLTTKVPNPGPITLARLSRCQDVKGTSLFSREGHWVQKAEHGLREQLFLFPQALGSLAIRDNGQGGAEMSALDRYLALGCLSVTILTLLCTPFW